MPSPDLQLSMGKWRHYPKYLGFYEHKIFHVKRLLLIFMVVKNQVKVIWVVMPDGVARSSDNTARCHNPENLDMYFICPWCL